MSVLACNVMMKAYSEEENWPDDFVKVGDIQASRLEGVTKDFFLYINQNVYCGYSNEPSQ